MEKRCCFCETTSLDELLGPFYTLSEYNFHSNCLVFSSDIRQNPDRTKGLNGFETKTIETTLYWGQKRTCTVCSKKGATMNCAGGDDNNSLPCEATYHLPCALQMKNTLHVYHQRTYCFEHIPYECIFDFDKITGIHFVTDCCKQIFSHENCTKTWVQEAKALSKCPNCLNGTEFKNSAKTMFSQSISNECPSFAQQLDQGFDLECIAKRCKCKDTAPGGERSSHCQTPRDKFNLIECNYCGSNAIHRVCGRLGRKTKPEWICPACIPGADLPSETERQSKKRKRAPENLGTNKKTVGNKGAASASATATIKKQPSKCVPPREIASKNIRRNRRGDSNAKLQNNGKIK
ncbi:PHD finger protein 7-like isoform X2 [Planococcus citri]|uniref:PHD finger protein 7-like isoform X2 n=1 Tax=Planococcus citri TaxID=170843 RepID=UPI0031F7A5EF